MNDKQSCTRDDLRCWVNVSHRYTVDSDGNAQYFMDSTHDDVSDLDEYGCQHCGNWWPVEKRYEDASRTDAWHATLDHLKVQDGLSRYQVQVNHRVNEKLETYLTHVWAKNLAQAKRMAKHIADGLDGRLVDVFEGADPKQEQAA